ncbi:hypothetical protein CHUAL_014120 [Chamberlinius hualienensis]
MGDYAFVAEKHNKIMCIMPAVLGQECTYNEQCLLGGNATFCNKNLTPAVCDCQYGHLMNTRNSNRNRLYCTSVKDNGITMILGLTNVTIGIAMIGASGVLIIVVLIFYLFKK